MRIKHPSEFIQYEGDCSPKEHTEEERKEILAAAEPFWARESDYPETLRVS